MKGIGVGTYVRRFAVCALLAHTFGFSVAAVAEATVKKQAYSPYVGESFPSKVLFGDVPEFHQSF